MTNIREAEEILHKVDGQNGWGPGRIIKGDLAKKVSTKF